MISSLPIFETQLTLDGAAGPVANCLSRWCHSKDLRFAVLRGWSYAFLKTYNYQNAFQIYILLKRHAWNAHFKELQLSSANLTSTFRSRSLCRTREPAMGAASGWTCGRQCNVSPQELACCYSQMIWLAEPFFWCQVCWECLRVGLRLETWNREIDQHMNRITRFWMVLKPLWFLFPRSSFSWQPPYVRVTSGNPEIRISATLTSQLQYFFVTKKGFLRQKHCKNQQNQVVFFHVLRSRHQKKKSRPPRIGRSAPSPWASEAPWARARRLDATASGASEGLGV